MEHPLGTRASRIRLFVMDVDGTLTDGTITYTADGLELKSFHAKDGAAIKLLAQVDVATAIVSGRASEATTRRAAELGIHELHQAIGDKAARVLEIADRLGIAPAEIAFVGDDLTDIPPMRLAGFSACPADAADEVRAVATFVSQYPGGRGAVREAIERLLKDEGRWDALIETLTASPALGQSA